MSRLVCVCLLISVAFISSGISQQQYQQQNNRNRNSAPQVARSPSSSSCPEANGRYPTGTCDGYIECTDGVPEEKLCADGLLFNAAVSVFAFPCQYPLDVDCTGRAATQTPQPTEDCPHQFGYYRLGDAANCGQFMNCVDGRGFTFDCPEGLAFNGATYRCDWPDQVQDCDAESYLKFTCPNEGKGFFSAGEYRSYKSPNDCQRYYICIDGRPRMYNCGEGYAYNELINACDGAENVTGCAVPYKAVDDSFVAIGGGNRQTQRNNYNRG